MSVDAKFIRDIDPYFQYPTDENPTTQQEYQEAVRNWVSTEEAIVDSHLWQPTTNYSEGNQVKTPSLPPQCVLVCTMAGASGNEEPDYTNVGVGDSVTDGTVTWLVSEALTSAGGVFGGNIEWNGINDDTFAVGMSDSNNDNVDVGWKYTDKKGAGIGLRNISHNDGGEFNLWATDGTNVKTLVGKPDGEFIWNGFKIPAGHLGDVPNQSSRTFTLPAAGTYLVMTAHNSSPGINTIYMVNLGANAFKLGGGSDLSMSTSGRNITVTVSTGGAARVYYIVLNTVS